MEHLQFNLDVSALCCLRCVIHSTIFSKESQSRRYSPNSNKSSIDNPCNRGTTSSGGRWYSNPKWFVLLCFDSAQHDGHSERSRRVLDSTTDVGLRYFLVSWWLRTIAEGPILLNIKKIDRIYRIEVEKFFTAFRWKLISVDTPFFIIKDWFHLFTFISTIFPILFHRIPPPGSTEK